MLAFRLKNGREIKPSEVYIMTKKDQTHSLTIKNTRLDDGGQYSVKAVNEGGELVSTAKLTVKGKALKVDLFANCNTLIRT